MNIRIKYDNSLRHEALSDIIIYCDTKLLINMMIYRDMNFCVRCKTFDKYDNLSRHQPLHSI